MERQLGHMVRLIDDLLDISRISRNKMELRRSRVLLADVVSSAVETSRPMIESAGHQLEVLLPAEPVCLDADLTRLAQVFGNLLTNSAKYTERGGRIWLTAAREAGRVTVVVRDTGIGIPADALPNIFDMFSQVDRSIERSTGGLGIGLALVKGLVEMHGGTVEAASAGLGKGSTFTVRLPILEDRAESIGGAWLDEAQPHFRGEARILVVDDNRDAATSMAMMLRLMGDEVRLAHDGIEAVQIAEAFRPRVILMDMGMPRLNGYEATPPHPRATVGPIRRHHRADRVGTRERQAPVAGGRVRLPPGEAGPLFRPGEAPGGVDRREHQHGGRQVEVATFLISLRRQAAKGECGGCKFKPRLVAERKSGEAGCLFSTARRCSAT